MDPRLAEAKKKLDELKDLASALKRDGIALHLRASHEKGYEMSIQDACLTASIVP